MEWSRLGETKKTNQQTQCPEAFVKFTLFKKPCIVSGVEVIHTQNEVPEKAISPLLEILNLRLDIPLEHTLYFNPLFSLQRILEKKSPPGIA